MSKCDSEGESRVMEMAEGSGKMQGKKRSRACKILECMEDKRGRII